ncbi:hypothetical protein [Nitratifractor salsuginis]|uniref:Uncharacterized protein n=1 Tax=Nitratifractor salsuginis (strain DSM 16511 / JCM 12458 / E9I37-1) TaxID=749222 RepID=E6X0K1_NITSE|nr:hypothetical protein [Nitratifractor salsuginis]ADV46851.1 hypothetical protein Nitsa_1603 [Nitratifractor salsuginis DSM 16511]
MRERETLLQNYPTLMSLFDDEDLDERRYFVVVDPNVEEEADEADVIDPTEYNWMIYLPERIAEAFGEELFAKIPQELAKVEAFEDFFDAEEDLYGVQCDLDEERIAAHVLEVLETLAREKKEGEA